MKIIASRFTKGMDLKEEIEKISVQHHLKAAVVLSSVGCLSSVNLRLAGAKEFIKSEGHFEVCSLNGTISIDGTHLHMVVSDVNGQCLGGHLVVGNIVDTTIELVIGYSEDYEFSRDYDESTGYRELIIRSVT